MKIKFPLFNTLAFSLALTAQVFAQPAENQTPATNDPAVQVEDSNTQTNEPNAFSVEDFTPGRGGVHREAVVIFGRDVELKASDVAGTVVVIGGNAKIDGKVKDAVVVIGGDITVNGYIRDAAVAIFGDIHAGKGAKLDGEIVAVGGRVESADDVNFRRSPVELDFGGLGKGLRAWIFQCVFKLRPLAPQVGWVWGVWAAFFLIYLLVALILPAPVRACAAELTRRPATTFFMGLLMKILVPLVFGILIATGVGAIVVPFLLAALIFGAIVGKVALFEFLGSSIGRRLGAGFLQNPLIAFLLGIALITLFYMVPVLGLITLGVVSVWGLGTAATAAFWGWKRELPDKKTNPPSSASPSPIGTPTPGFASPNPAFTSTDPVASPGISENPASAVPPLSAASGATTAPFSPPTPPASVPEAYAYPRANFWERMGAGFLDIVLVGFIMGLIHRAPFGFLAALAYFAGMWAWKGTTVGGVVVGLKVVRQDGYPLTLLVSIVRGLAAAFSIVMFFLGFLWIIWDREKQGWHDKIAGTVVVRLPKGTPLVCL
jgi:uncharacterized RDD family membrane protein YckC